ncbi:MAG: tetratricopeptide repeat protein [Planctomycetota bacterium]
MHRRRCGRRLVRLPRPRGRRRALRRAALRRSRRGRRRRPAQRDGPALRAHRHAPRRPRGRAAQRRCGLVRSERGGAREPDAASDGTGAKDDGKVGEDEIAALFGGGIGDGERWDLLDRLRKSGQLDEVLERLQERADANPNDPEAQFEVGMAYIMKLQSVGASFEAGPLANKADAAFDRTLALDEDHLGARKAKAISLSFWPPIFGKQPKAIEQFEILIDKQKQFPPNPDFADSYVLLGNLYLQSGKTDEAAKVFQQGLDAYPDDEALADLMKDVQGGK